jgi:hypothetical protein
MLYLSKTLRLVSGHLHRDPLRDTRSNEIADARAAQVMRNCAGVAAALDSLAKHLNLLEPLPEPAPPPMNVQVNMGEMYLERLLLEDLQQLRRIMVAAGVEAPPPVLPSSASPTFGVPGEQAEWLPSGRK